MSLEKDLKTFDSFAGIETDFCRITQAGPYILHLQTKAKIKSKSTVGFLALVHGNELLGLPILNSLIQSLVSGEFVTDSDLYFGLGNIPAAFADKRFVEEDLNRCFGKNNFDSIESKRARELESLMLNHCDFLMDIHQTIFSSEKPFFIFEYTSERCLAIMEEWNTNVSVILQQNPLGTNTGLCADEYMKSRGGFGAALELGQLGTSNHFDLGLEICKRVLDTTTDELLKPQSPKAPLNFEVLKLESSFKVTDSSYKLDEGWRNLKGFSKGQKLGTCDAGEVLAPVSGFILFPRYRALSEGQELFYYCTPMFDNIKIKESIEELA